MFYYSECTHNNSEEKVKKTRELLKDLEENQMSSKLPAGRILSYDVKWNKETGICVAKLNVYITLLTVIFWFTESIHLGKEFINCPI